MLCQTLALSALRSAYSQSSPGQGSPRPAGLLYNPRPTKEPFQTWKALCPATEMQQSSGLKLAFLLTCLRNRLLTRSTTRTCKMRERDDYCPRRVGTLSAFLLPGIQTAAGGGGGGVAHLWFPDVATIATNDVGGKGMGKGFPELLAFNTEATGWDMCMPQTGLPALFGDWLRQSLWDRPVVCGLLMWAKDAGGTLLFPFHQVCTPHSQGSLLLATHSALSFLLMRQEERDPEERIHLESKSSCKYWGFIKGSRISTLPFPPQSGAETQGRVGWGKHVA